MAVTGPDGQLTQVTFTTDHTGSTIARITWPDGTVPGGTTLSAALTGPGGESVPGVVQSLTTPEDEVVPTPEPTAEPRTEPTPEPTTEPTEDPTPAPISSPTPTAQPTRQPSQEPIVPQPTVTSTPGATAPGDGPDAAAPGNGAAPEPAPAAPEQAGPAQEAEASPAQQWWGEQLPHTGVSNGSLVIAGGVLLLAGAGLVGGSALRRRRRS